MQSQIELEIAQMRPEDWPSVARIYAAGIVGGNATFESSVPDWESWSETHTERARLVAMDPRRRVLGWAALSPVSTRCVYRGVVEVSVYVDPDFTRLGVGHSLLRALVRESEDAGFWTLQAGIFPENLASIALHERCGFRLVGVRQRLGQMADGSWRDVALYERRSELFG